jgi:hypothetical protein
MRKNNGTKIENILLKISPAFYTFAVSISIDQGVWIQTLLSTGFLCK